MPAPAGDSHEVVSVIPRASKNGRGATTAAARGLSRSARQSSASTVTPVSTD